MEHIDGASDRPDLAAPLFRWHDGITGWNRNGGVVLARAVTEIVLTRFLERYVADDFDDRLRSLLRSSNDFGVDPFGFEPQYLRYAVPFAWFLHRLYFRVESHGLEHVPAGRVLFVANHSGQIALDGIMLATSMLLDAKPPRMLRAMLEHWVPTLPFVSVFMARCGQVVGLPDNCARLLEQEEAILVFPEGLRGITKTWHRRYQLQQFGQGFMRLACAHRAPIVPVAIIGAEEQIPTFYNLKALGKLVNMPSFPITPTFPWLFPIGLLPYPVKYRIHVGKPMFFEGDPLEDDETMAGKVEEVRRAIDRMLEQGLKEREHVFW